MALAVNSIEFLFRIYCEGNIRLREGQFLSVIVGASGSGKSSLVRAGLIPALKKQSTDWQIHVLTPTAHPLETLATELTRHLESVTAAAALMDDLRQDPHSSMLGLVPARPG